jgi:acyl-CoA reductase-like NAD-dependent aldehyde dehydrogenase
MLMNIHVAERALKASPFAKSYDNFIGGRWVEPKGGRYFDNISPITGKPVCKVARSDAADIELALDAAHAAKEASYGLGAGVWSRDANTCYRFGRAIQAGRVWTNCYHAYPAHAAFGGYKQSGIGRETHKMMLDHYQQTKNLLVSYSPKKLGFF